MPDDATRALEFDYLNHKGEAARRLVMPDNIFYGATDFYRVPCWLMLAFDLGKRRWRTFALAKCLNVVRGRPVTMGEIDAAATTPLGE